MSDELMNAVAQALGLPTSALLGTSERLYHLESSGALSATVEQLLVEAWWMHEALDELFELQITCLSVEPLDLDSLLGQPLRLRTTLADGSFSYRSGLIHEAQTLDCDGGLHRHVLRIAPWPWLLTRQRASGIFQERTLQDIVDTSFALASPVAQWTWSAEVSEFLGSSNGGGTRSWVTQYRESPWAFAQRLLAADGLGLRLEEDESAPQQHRVVVFADSTDPAACPEDPSSAAGGGIRYHRAASQEDSDTLQAFGPVAGFEASSTTVLSWDYKARRAVAASVPSASLPLGPDAPQLEDYEPLGAYAHTDSGAAEHHARLRRERSEAQAQRYRGHGSVRSFRAGTSFALTQSWLDMASDAPQRFVLTAVTSAGINNLPVEMQRALQARWWSGQAGAALLPAELDDAVVAQARSTGYGNSFDAIAATTPWRPAPRTKPAAPAAQSAVVVGPNGETMASGAEQIHCDALGRVRIAFAWQAGQRPDDRNTGWVRVAQAYAGAGHGSQWLPRIGHEVLVGHLDGDIDRPVVRASLYNGRGEGGVPATPGGQSADADTSVFDASSDSRPSGQGNLSGGNAPAWHGAAADAQANAAVLSGFKSQEFGGAGYNQLVFDDSDSQLRTQFGSTQHASWLSLGHLIHQADNHRGSFRGLGFELRTDAWGAARAPQGLLVSSYATDAADPAGDNAPGQALVQQMVQLAQTFNQAAQTHQTVQLASQIGSSGANANSLGELAPLPRLKRALDGMVEPASFDDALQDGASANTSPADKLPASADGVIAVSARGGLNLTSQDHVRAANDTIHTGTGQDHTQAVGGAYRLHTGQAIGVLGGAVQPGSEAAGTGLTLIAGQGDVQLQAQAGTLQIAAKQLVNVQSANGHIDWAAAKKITLKTAQGACIEISGDGITTQCPGTITVQAATKAMEGAAQQSYAMPQMPRMVMTLKRQRPLSR